MKRNSSLKWADLFLLTATMLTLVSSADADFQSELSNARPCDEIWLVSARDYDCQCELDASELRCHKYCNCAWSEASWVELHASDQTVQNAVTVVFVHGYQTDLHLAQTRGLQVYENLSSGNRSTNPIRFVIWAWRSEKEIRRPIQDFTIKSQRAIRLGDIFASTLNQLGPRPLVVVAYSLGSQVAISALASSNVYVGEPVQLAVIAAATDCGFASCCQQLQKCGNIERSYIFTNKADSAIRASRLACRISTGQPARTLEDLAPNFSDQLGQINIFDITNIASRRHSVILYTELPVVVSCINELVSASTCRDQDVEWRSVSGFDVHYRDDIAVAGLVLQRNVCRTR